MGEHSAMAIVSIVYLPHRRKEYRDLTFHFLKRLSSDDKGKFILYVVDDDASLWASELALLQDHGIHAELVLVSRDGNGYNYMPKLYAALAKVTTPYCIKLDEDCFMSEGVWSYWLEQIPTVLAESENLTLAPMLSNGIPSCEWFLHDFLAPATEEYNALLREFAKVEFRSYWGNDYTSLNAYTVESGIFNADFFYEAVKKLPYFYKGVHPVRMSGHLQRRINDLILADMPRFLNPSEMTIKEIDAPYFCNSCFAIRTDDWLTIVTREDLQRDSFDEVPLNLYREERNAKMMFIRRGYGVHTMYGFARDLDGDKAMHHLMRHACELV